MNKKTFSEQYPGYELIPDKSSRWTKPASLIAVLALLIAIPYFLMRTLSYNVPTPATVGDQRFTLPTLKQVALNQSAQKDYRSALVSFDKYFALGGQEADMMAMYAYVLSEVGRKDEAIPWSRKAVAKDPKSKAANMIHEALEPR